MVPKFLPLSLLCLAASVLPVHNVLGALIASDDGTQPAYNAANGGFTNGDNGGFGFLAWQSTNQFRGNSINTGAGTGPGIGSLAFGFFDTGTRVRPFTGNLDIGQTFNVLFANGFLNNGIIAGISIGSSTQSRLTFQFTGGTSKYQLLDNSGSVNTGMDFRSGGFSLSFTLTGADTYSFTATDLTATAQTFTTTGTLAGVAGSGVDRMRLIIVGDTATGQDVFVNNLAIVPEPGVATLGILALSVACLGYGRRRTGGV